MVQQVPGPILPRQPAHRCVPGRIHAHPRLERALRRALGPDNMPICGPIHPLPSATGAILAIKRLRKEATLG